MKKVFIDSDIILDVALSRHPFFENSRLILAIIENDYAIGYTSSNCIANIYYVLRKLGNDKNARKFIKIITSYITVIPIEHSDIIFAIDSDILDFEDAIQHYSAVRNQCNCIITRNIKDYKKSAITIYTPIEFLNLYKS